MAEHKGIARAKSQYGIKFSEDGPWFNWAKPEKRGTPFHDVSKGDSVRIEYGSWDKDDGSKGYTIYVVENLSRAGGIGPQDDPFPLEDDTGDLGDDRAFPTDAGRASSEPVDERQQSIVRQSSAKTAAGYLVAKDGESTEEAGARLTNLAGIIEDWVNR